jgi:polysaccharide biosynthesis protein PslH
LRILYVARDCPVEPLTGSNWFAYNLINSMARSHECHLICLGAPAQAVRAREWEASLPGLRVLGVLPVQRRQLVGWWRAANYLFDLRVPYLVQWATRDFTRAIRSAVRDTPYDVVHFTDISLVFYRNLVNDAPTVISGPDPASLHLRANIAFEPSRLERLKLAATARAYGRIERTRLRAFSAVHVVSESDAEYLRRSAGLKNVVAISLAVDPRFTSPPLDPRPTDGGATLFSAGLFSVPHVRIPFLAFFDEHWEGIRKNYPRTRWIVVGRGAPADVKKRLASAPGVAYHDGILDYDSALFQSDIAVFLDGSGTGMKSRVLQAMGAGKAVVGTLSAFNGLDVTNGVHGFVAECPDSAMKALGLLLASPQLRRHLGEAARAFVEARFSREAIGRQWESFYARLSREHAHAPDPHA